MIYIEMSDFEINCAVAKALGLEDSMFFSAESDYCNGPVWTIESGVTKGGIKASKGNSFDPCNSWADAGPIFEENKISIFSDSDEDSDTDKSPNDHWWSAISFDTGCQQNGEKNPRRAGLIVFLMMKGGE